MKRELEKIENYNYSIAFMKAFFSFCVVCCHYWTPEYIDFYPAQMLYRMRTVAVPVFIIISSFLTEYIYEKKTSKIRERVWRLLFPFWGWGVLYFVGYKCIDILLKWLGLEAGLGLGFTYTDLVWQLVFGSDKYLCPQMWYLFDVIVITVLMWLVFNYFSKYAYRIVLFLPIFALWLQYSGVNYLIFGGYEYEVRYSTGRIMEVVPMACIGLAFAHYGVVERLKENRWYAIMICMSGMILVASCGLFTTPSEGFGYGGTHILVYAVLAFILFYELPFEMMPKFVKSLLYFGAKYSFGVFCLHFGIGYLLNSVICGFWGLRTNTLLECTFIYVICICLSWLISLIPVKYAKILVE